MDYDPGEIFCFVVIFLFVFGFIGTIVAALTDSVFMEPIRAEDAQNQCESKGFDVYTDYRGILRTQAYGVKCAYVDYDRRQIDVDTADAGSSEQVKTIVLT